MNLNYKDIELIMQTLKSDSFYLFDSKLFENNFRLFKNEFLSRYPNLIIGYSYKTNYLPRICKIANRAGAYAEVVSNLEYNLAETLCPDTKIIYNGPLKSQSSLEKALLANQIVNLDSFYELEYLDLISKNHPDKNFKVGLRCTFNLKNESPSRFGFDSNNGNINSAFNRVNALPNFKVSGLHCHFSANDNSESSYIERCKKVISIADSLFLDSDPEYIDIGGGFYSNMKPELLKTLKIKEATTFNTYAKEITTIFNHRYPQQNVTLIIEPGRALVANTIAFFCTVKDIKKIGKTNIALVSAGIHNIKPQGSRINLPFELLSHNNDAKIVRNSYDLVGYTCMESDILFKDYIGNISVSDILKYDNMGAYVNVFKPPFISGQYPIINLENDKEINILKRAADHTDFLNTYTY